VDRVVIGVDPDNACATGTRVGNRASTTCSTWPGWSRCGTKRRTRLYRQARPRESPWKRCAACAAAYPTPSAGKWPTTRPRSRPTLAARPRCQRGAAHRTNDIDTDQRRRILSSTGPCPRQTPS